MEAEMKMVFQQKVQEKEAKLKQSEEELYARHKEMKDALEKQRADLEDKKRKIESGRPLTPEKSSVSCIKGVPFINTDRSLLFLDHQKEGLPATHVGKWHFREYEESGIPLNPIPMIFNVDTLVARLYPLLYVFCIHDLFDLSLPTHSLSCFL